MNIMTSRNPISVAILSLALAACSTVPGPVADTAQSDREPASLEEKAPDLKNTQWRVIQPMTLTPMKFGGRSAVLVANGQVLKASQVKDLRESASPKIMQYCAVYTTESLHLVAGEVFTVGVAMPQTAHWEPGHIYVLQSPQHKGMQGFGCFSLAEDGRSRITEKEIREHLRGLVEQVQ